MSSERFLIRTAVYLLPFKDNQVLLLRRFNTGWNDGQYSLISGHLEKDETPLQAAARESKEEAGIDVNLENLKLATTIFRSSPNFPYIDLFFATNSWQGEIHNAEPDKCDDMSWFSLDSLPKNILPYIKLAIQNYQNGILYAETTR